MPSHEPHLHPSNWFTLPNTAFHSLRRSASSHGKDTTPTRVASRLRDVFDQSDPSREMHRLSTTSPLTPDLTRPRLARLLSTPLLSTRKSLSLKRRPLSWLPSTKSHAQDCDINSFPDDTVNLPQALDQGTSSEIRLDRDVGHGGASLHGNRCSWQPASNTCQPEKQSIPSSSMTSWHKRKTSWFGLSNQQGTTHSHLVHAVTGKLRSVRSISHGVPLQLRGFEASNDSLCQPSVEDAIARKQAETVNLCNEKIHQMTGHGRIRRKSVNNSGEGNLMIVPSPGAGPVRLRSPLYNSAQSDSSTQLPLSHSNCTTDLRHGSRTRSLGGGIEDLNRQTSSESMAKMRLPRNSKSLFNLRKAGPEAKGSEDNNDKRTPNKIRKEKPGAVNEPGDGLLCSSETPRHVTPTQTDGRDVGLHDPVMGRSTVSLAQAAGLDGLRMHPNTTEFAKTPPHISGLPTPSKATVENKRSVDDEEEGSIDAATLYNEVSGNLTHYSRQTPPSSTTMSRAGHDNSMPTTDTSTKKPGRGLSKVRRGLKKTKTMLKLSDRAKGKRGDKMKDKATQTDTQNEGGGLSTDVKGKQQKGTASHDILPHQPVTPSPLRQEHEQDTVYPIIRRAVRYSSQEEKEEMQKKRQGGYGALDILPASPFPKRSSV